MKGLDVVRAWKDPVYRASLSAAERSALPANPCGLVEVSDDQLKAASGGTTTAPTCTMNSFHHWLACCPSTT